VAAVQVQLVYHQIALDRATVVQESPAQYLAQLPFMLVAAAALLMRHQVRQ
jgi:hypothetical protein